MRATPAAGYYLDRWNGCDSVNPETKLCLVKINSNTDVTAVFRKTPTLKVVITDKEKDMGKVTSRPAGINCGQVCSANYRPDSQVTLTAQAFGGYAFDGWFGCDSDDGRSCSVTMGNSSQEVFAYFYKVDAELLQNPLVP